MMGWYPYILKNNIFNLVDLPENKTGKYFAFILKKLRTVWSSSSQPIVGGVLEVFQGVNGKCQ
jgi:hypothetical protein